MTSQPIHSADEIPQDANDAARQSFDGVVCVGGVDWWYHNRGHYDLQMMRRMSRSIPVLYVNSIGMRMPRPDEGRMFLKRMWRKARSVRRGFAAVDDGFGVLTPFAVPGHHGMAATRSILRRQIRHATRRMGIERPLLWIACPPGAEVVEAVDAAALVYQRTDRFECFAGVDEMQIRRYDLWLKARADLTVFCSSLLIREEGEDCRRTCFTDHGVDDERFIAPTALNEPADLANIPGPRVGFVGGIDAHTFDPALFNRVAAALPHAQFVLVGACSLPHGWCELDNVHMLGQRSYEAVPAYMHGCDVLIMPWNRSRWIEGCNPVKLKEYLAAGRPVVSTPFPELQRYADLVTEVDTAESFAGAIRTALDQPHDPAPGRRRIRGESWTAKVALVLRELEQMGHGPARLDPDLREALTDLHPCEPFAVTMAAGDAPTMATPSATAATELNLVDCIILSGGLNPSPLISASGRSILDLWLTDSATVVDLWVERLRGIDGLAGSLPQIHIVHDENIPVPWSTAKHNGSMRVSREPAAYRGPAGVVADCCPSREHSEHVLIGEAARFVSCSLQAMVERHVSRDADITVAINADGSPAGVYLARCDALELIPSVGFMDLKEQWLTQAIDAGLTAQVHHLQHHGAMPLRTTQQFIRAARIASGDRSDNNETIGDQQARSLSVVCPGARVEPGAQIVDSIIMPEAVIGADAVVVRSIVFPAASVEPGAAVEDALVAAERRRPSRTLQRSA